MAARDDSAPNPRTTSGAASPTPAAELRPPAGIAALLVGAVPLGAVVGVAIAGYDELVNEVLLPRVTSAAPWVALGAPFAALLVTALAVQFFRVASTSMADDVVRRFHGDAAAPPLREDAGKLVASLATLGLGASAGMEGASKWLGATVAERLRALFTRSPLRALVPDARTATLVGGAAGMAAIFRAPLAGAVMGVESPYRRDLAYDHLLPALLASAVSFATFTLFRPATAYFPVPSEYAANAHDLLGAALLGVFAGLAGRGYTAGLAGTRAWLSERIARPLVRAAVGGVVLVALGVLADRLVGAPVTNGPGLPYARSALAGEYGLAALLGIVLLKSLSTWITFGAGGVGGLFVPTATVGAATGAAVASLLAGVLPSADPLLYGLLGIAAFVGATYRSLLFAAVFVAESTGNVHLMVPAIVASGLAWATAAGVSASRAQRESRVE